MISFLYFISLLLYVYSIIIIVNVVFSWLYAFNIVNPRNRFIAAIGNFLYQATEPVFQPIRRLLPATGSLDFSPVIVLLIVYLLQELVAQAMYSLQVGY